MARGDPRQSIPNLAGVAVPRHCLGCRGALFKGASPRQKRRSVMHATRAMAAPTHILLVPTPGWMEDLDMLPPTDRSPTIRLRGVTSPWNGCMLLFCWPSSAVALAPTPHGFGTNRVEQAQDERSSHRYVIVQHALQVERQTR